MSDSTGVRIGRTDVHEFNWICDYCPSTNIVAVTVGSNAEPDLERNLSTSDDSVVVFDTPNEFWCRSCWLRRFGDNGSDERSDSAGR